jgi:cytochrome P450
MPILDRLLRKNPYQARKTKISPSTNPFATFSRARIAERKSPSYKPPSDSRRDLLSRFLSAQESSPEIVNDRQVLSYVMMNVFAGSDSTAISLRTIFYYLHRNQDTLRRLREELDEAAEKGKLGRFRSLPP